MKRIYTPIGVGIGSIPTLMTQQHLIDKSEKSASYMTNRFNSINKALTL